MFVRRARRDPIVKRRARIALPALTLAIILLLSLFAAQLAPYDPRHAEAGQGLRPPSAAHWLGTDLLGRDVFSRLLFGGQRTLLLGVLALILSALPGALIELTAGYVGGWPDRVVRVVIDALLAFPNLLLAFTVIAVLGSGWTQITLAVGLAGIAPYARVTRAAMREAKSRPFVEAARALGARPARVVLIHVVPTIAPPLIAFAAVTLSWAILNGAALAFLGFTGDLAAPDWGVMLAAGREILPVAPWAAFAPGITLSVTIFAINQLADALTD